MRWSDNGNSHIQNLPLQNVETVKILGMLLSLITADPTSKILILKAL